MLKDKVKAFFIHFAISAILVLLAGLIIFYLWYPKPYSQLFDVKPIFLLMIGVDVILGPLLTFIVYKKGKKTLKMDLAVIALVQLFAFGWAMWNIANARPAWIAIYKDTAYAVSPAFLSNPENKLNVVTPSIFEQNWLKPKLIMLSSNETDPKAIYHTEKYLSFDDKTASVNKLPLNKVEQADKALFDSIKNTYPTAIGYYPIITEASSDIPLLLINNKGQPVATVLAKNKVTVHKK